MQLLKASSVKLIYILTLLFIYKSGANYYIIAPELITT
jgi:hypothetical protein